MSNKEITHVWNAQTPVFNTVANDFIPNIAIDGAGNIFVVYYVNNGLVSGGSRAGAQEIIIFKLRGNDGIHLWSSQTPVFNTAIQDRNPSIATDTDNNVFLTYRSVGKISGGSANSPLSDEDIIVIKLRGSDGTLLWSKQSPVFNTIGNDSFPDIAIGPDKNPVVAFQIDSGAISGGSDSTGQDIAVIKLNGVDGNLIWSKQSPVFNSAGSGMFVRITIPKAGSNDIFLSFTTDGAPISGGSLVSAGNSDIVVVRIDGTDGDLIWSKQTPVFNTNLDVADDRVWIALDNNNNVLVSYSTEGTISGGSIGNSSGRNIAVIKLNYQDGTFAWSKQIPTFNTNLSDDTPKIVSDSSNNPMIVYRTNGGTVSGGSLAGSDDIILFKLNGDTGNLIFTQQSPVFNTSLNDVTPDIEFDLKGNIYIAYRSLGGIVSGGSLYQGEDIIVAKLSFTSPVICVHQDMIIDDLGIPIKKVRSYSSDFIKVLYTGKASVFVKLSKNSLSNGVPSADLLLTPGHKIAYKGKHVPVRKLTFKLGIDYCYLDEAVPTYNLCFRKDKSVKIHGVDVMQWGLSRFKKLLRKNDWVYSKSQGIRPKQSVSGSIKHPRK